MTYRSNGQVHINSSDNKEPPDTPKVASIHKEVTMPSETEEELQRDVKVDKEVVAIWEQFLHLLSQVESWIFVDQLEDIGSLIWDCFKFYRRSGLLPTLEGVLENDVNDGRRHANSLKEFLPTLAKVSGDDLQLMLEEYSDLLKRVSEATAAIQMRLDLMRNGSAIKYPKIMNPAPIYA